jgi:hypothetical protein
MYWGLIVVAFLALVAGTRRASWVSRRAWLWRVRRPNVGRDWTELLAGYWLVVSVACSIIAIVVWRGRP